MSNEQTHILVGSKITTQREYPACVVEGITVYGYLPAGAVGVVVGHTADGRVMITFGGEIHTFESLENLIVERNEQDRWTDERLIEQYTKPLLTQIGEESAAAVEILQRHGLWPTSGFVGIVSVAHVLMQLEALIAAAKQRIVELERAAVWVPASGHIQSTDSDDTLTVDGRWLVINAGSLKNIAIKLPDGYRLMYRRQPQPDSEV